MVRMSVDVLDIFGTIRPDVRADPHDGMKEVSPMVGTRKTSFLRRRRFLLLSFRGWKRGAITRWMTCCKVCHWSLRLLVRYARQTAKQPLAFCCKPPAVLSLLHLVVIPQALECGFELLA
jgi:hypothetical protein